MTLLLDASRDDHQISLPHAHRETDWKRADLRRRLLAIVPGEHPSDGAEGKIRTRPKITVSGRSRRNRLGSEPWRGREAVAKILSDLSMRMPSGLFRTGSRPQLPAMLTGADLAEHSSANSLKIAPAINDNSGVMLIWCIGDAVHR